MKCIVQRVDYSLQSALCSVNKCTLYRVLCVECSLKLHGEDKPDQYAMCILHVECVYPNVESEMEKAYKIAQMKISGPKISTKTRTWRHIAIRAKKA